MRFPSMANKKELLSAYGQIVLGCVIGAAAYPAFLVPNRIAPGGLTGMAIILNHLFGLPIGTTSLLMNIPLFLMGYKAMGGIFAFRSLLATLLFSVLIDLLPLPVISSDPLLGTLFGGAVLGIGLGLILRGGATTGGTDMIARMVHRRFPFITVGAFLFALDFAVVLAAGVGAWGAAALSLPSPQPAREMAMASRLAVARGIRIMANILLRLLIGRAGERKNCDIMRKICILCKGLNAGNISYRLTRSKNDRVIALGLL